MHWANKVELTKKLKLTGDKELREAKEESKIVPVPKGRSISE